jgi:tryptophan synthase alpha chain
MRIRELFIKARHDEYKLFIPYITCGDPALEITEELVIKLTEVGADVIELGVPFSDPMADGPTNQLAAMRALKNHVSLRDCCELVTKVRNQGCNVPIVLFTYLNPILRLGVSEFAQLAQHSGVDAVLIVDLPVDESEEITAELKRYNVGMIMLIAPTTTPERIVRSIQAAPEFLYYVSRTGVTGTQKDISASLENELMELRRHTSLPIAVGFGISTSPQAAAVAKLADGVIVGSALVKQLETQDVISGKMKLLNLAVELNNAIKERET